MISVDKIKENIKCPQFGDRYYGKWGAQKLEIREALKFMCDLCDSMDSIIKQQHETMKLVREYIIENMGYYSDRLECKEYTERYVKDLNKIINLLDNVKITDENNKEDNLLHISNTLENILYVLERIEKKIYEED